ncbi:hypothetical protein H8B15_11015 [Hymenobacter sp. BT507]|uniref:Uncharacterized protein n=1 Tax=Hymenobacter citatus TaxID=2763506 RepID=A0ABR7MLP7_9BACT|nr:hypothetical protein [Hymenobacter citatus]MBC6611458.1 hypothetical protein [Hymenobacter citatus]
MTILLQSNKISERQFMQKKGFKLIKEAQDRGYKWRTPNDRALSIDRSANGNVSSVNYSLTENCFYSFKKQIISKGLKSEGQRIKTNSLTYYYSNAKYGAILQRMTVPTAGNEMYYYIFFMRKEEYIREKIRKQNISY